VQAVAKCSTSNILGLDWIEVTWEMSGRLPQQCQERYRLAHILAELTFVFLCVTFRGSPFIHYAPASSFLCVYNDSRDSSNKPAPSPSLCYSLTHAHRSIGYRNIPQPLDDSVARLIYLRVYDSRDGASEPAPSPSPPSSLTHVHSIQTPTLPTPTLLTCTQFLWFLSRLTRSRVSGVTNRPSTRLTIISTRSTQCM
jgi:hypothetical protein